MCQHTSYDVLQQTVNNKMAEFNNLILLPLLFTKITDPLFHSKSQTATLCGTLAIRVEY